MIRLQPWQMTKRILRKKMKNSKLKIRFHCSSVNNLATQILRSGKCLLQRVLLHIARP